MNNINTRDLRQALGQFMTGVTIVTTVDDNVEPRGVTANSFSSISLDPPLVLWALSKNADCMNAFQNAEYFCIHVLTSSQRELAEQFACSGADKFSDVEWSRGHGSVPLLSEYVAQFQCRTTTQHPGGDHIVFFGEVLQFDKTDKRPLVFLGGRFSLAERRNSVNDPQVSGGNDTYSEDRRTPAAK